MLSTYLIVLHNDCLGLKKKLISVKHYNFTPHKDSEYWR